MKKVTCFASAALVFAGAAILANPAQAASGLEGKTVTVVMGLGPASAGTTVGRILSKHLGNFVEGKPTFIVKNMPGAGLMKAHKFLLGKARKDGTTIYYGPRRPVGEIFKTPGMNFSYKKFTALGGVQVASLVIYARNDTVGGGLKSAGDIVKSTNLKYGGLSATQARMIITMLGLDMIGAKYKFVSGYRGSGKIRAAILSNEINVATDAAHAYLRQAVPQLVKKGIAKPLFHVPLTDNAGNLMKSPMVPDIPTIGELYKSVHGKAPSGVQWDAIKTLIKVDQTMQHVFLGPPGMDKKAAAAIRKAIVPAFTSAAYKAEATKVLSYAPEPVDWQRAEKILASASGASKEVATFLEAFVKKKQRK